MSDINYTEFMNRVQVRLSSYSEEILREILYEWAKHTPSNKRVEFLNKFDLNIIYFFLMNR